MQKSTKKRKKRPRQEQGEHTYTHTHTCKASKEARTHSQSAYKTLAHTHALRNTHTCKRRDTKKEEAQTTFLSTDRSLYEIKFLGHARCVAALQKGEKSLAAAQRIKQKTVETSEKQVKRKLLKGGRRNIIVSVLWRTERSVVQCSGEQQQQPQPPPLLKENQFYYFHLNLLIILHKKGNVHTNVCVRCACVCQCLCCCCC